MQCHTIILKEHMKLLLSALQMRLPSFPEVNYIGKEIAEENKGIARRFYIKYIFLEYYLLFCTHFYLEQKEK